jgi:cytochrome b involved in lipid metabolism
MFIDNNVYDVTNFKHPGGKPHLLQNAGQDASQAFEDIGHAPDKVGPWLEKLWIGKYVNPDQDNKLNKAAIQEAS